VRVLAPSTAERFHEVNRGGELLAAHLHRLPLIAKQNLLRRDHFQIRIHTAFVSGGGDVERILRAAHAGVSLRHGTIESDGSPTGIAGSDEVASAAGIAKPGAGVPSRVAIACSYCALW